MLFSFFFVRINYRDRLSTCSICFAFVPFFILSSVAKKWNYTWTPFEIVAITWCECLGSKSTAFSHMLRRFVSLALCERISGRDFGLLCELRDQRDSYNSFRSLISLILESITFSVFFFCRFCFDQRKRKIALKINRKNPREIGGNKLNAIEFRFRVFCLCFVAVVVGAVLECNARQVTLFSLVQLETVCLRSRNEFQLETAAKMATTAIIKKNSKWNEPNETNFESSIQSKRN